MSNFSEEVIARFRVAFEMFDNDNDGALNFEELADLFEQTGYKISENEFNDIIKELDINRNGLIDYKEFITLMARRIRDDSLEEEQIEAFNLFDKEKDGLISFDELKAMMTIIGKQLTGNTITDEEVREMIHIADTDGDGFISYKEFDKIINDSSF